MDVSVKELALKQLIGKINLLDEQLEGSTSKYYISFPISVNGFIIETTIQEIIESIRRDIENIVIKDFYNEIDNIDSN